MTNVTFDLESITKSFEGLKVLNDISFTVKGEEVLGIIGPNGSGKTTLLDIISGFLQPDEGRIFVGDVDITNLAPHVRASLGIGRLFQNTRAFNKLTVLENMLLAQSNSREESIWSAILTGSGLVKKNTNQSIYNSRYWLDYVGLEVKENELAENLSYGQEKLLALAMILARDSRFILLDEPAAGLDLRMKEKISSMIKKLRDSGKTIIVIEHALDFVFDVSDKVILLNGGRKVFEGNPGKINNELNIKEAYTNNYAEV